jgi:hypothetical protein
LTSSNKSGGIKEILEHNYRDKEHLQSIAAITKIIENGIYIDTIYNEDTTKHPNVTSYDYYVCGLKINEIDYTVKAVIANTENGDRYYDHKLTNIEKGKLIDIINKVSKSSEAISTATLQSETLFKQK